MNKRILHHLQWHIAAPRGIGIVAFGLLTDFCIATVKFSAATASGSSAMSSEGVHSLVDAATEVLLLYGLMASSRRPSRDHQLGYGREVYFWNFVVAILIFALGAGAALLDGSRQIVMPAAVEPTWINFAVLSAAGALEAAFLYVAISKTRINRGKASLYAFLKRRRDPTASTIVFGGAASLAGVAATALGLILSATTGDSRFDGAASIAIALILSLTAFKLASQSKALLIGVPADQVTVDEILSEVRSMPAVKTVNGMVSAHLGPDQILVALSVWFEEELSKAGVEQAIANIEDTLRKRHTEIVSLFVKPQSPERFGQMQRLGLYPLEVTTTDMIDKLPTTIAPLAR